MCIFMQNDLQPYLPIRILLGAVKYSQHLTATLGDSGQGLGPSSEGVSEAQAVVWTFPLIQWPCLSNFCTLPQPYQPSMPKELFASTLSNLTAIT